MGRHLDPLALFPCQNIVAAIAFIIDVFGTHEGAHAAIFIVLLQALPIVARVVVQVEQVVRCATMIFLPRIELTFLHFKDFCIAHVASFHVFKSVDFTTVALFTQVGPFVLHVLELVLTNFLICD
mmetsp:Transcript_8813/g.10454  ORF Transcript_8813/g.10454 Transcript_8813/m.10454 type:complete len:125 (-) Transcript_8813:257-631(-)